MSRKTSNLWRRFLQAFFVMVLLAVICLAQEGTPRANSSADSHATKTYVEQNGTWQWTRTIETEHHVTSDGEVEIQRLRAPAYEGDMSVSWEREVHTRKLPDGTIEKECIVRNPDGSGQLAPVQIIREKATPGVDATVVQRETLERPGGTDWQAVQSEHITEKGVDNAQKAFKEVRRLNLTTHEWETTEQQTSSKSTKTEGGTTEAETRSVRQRPDAFGKLADFERRYERSVSTDGKQMTESTVYVRDNSTIDRDDSGQFYLLDHTTSEVVTVAPATTTRHVVRESELLYGDRERNYSLHPEIVEEKTTVEKRSPDGSIHSETTVIGRTSGEPTALRPIYTVIEDSDTAGYVRRIYIPDR